jgi:hypothetical protein
MGKAAIPGYRAAARRREHLTGGIVGVLVRMTNLYGAEVMSEGAPLGRANDFLIDLDRGFLRYLCLAMPEWERPVAVPMSAIAPPPPEPAIRELTTGLTRQEVESLTAFDLISHCDRNVEAALHRILHWAPYWPTDGSGGHPELRLGRVATGLHVKAADGPAGYLVDLLVELDHWAVPVLVLNTGEVLRRDTVLVPIGLMAEMDWTGQAAYLNVTRQQIEASPPWEQGRPYTETQLDVLRAHFSH